MPTNSPEPMEEARTLLANAAHGPLTLIRYEHGGGRLYREEPRDLVADFYDEGNRELYARAPELLRTLADEVSALRERLAQAHDDNERAALALQNIEEREAAVCPEDVGFDEYIRSLQSQLAALTRERDERLAEVEHWVNRYNELEAWRVQTTQRLAAVEQERNAYKLQVEAPYKEAIKGSLEFGNRAAIQMRDLCVEKLREYGEFHLSEMRYKSRAGREDEANAHASRSVAADELVPQIGSLTLDQVKEKQS